MIEVGIYHPFSFVSELEDINPNCILATPVLQFVIKGTHSSISFVEYGTSVTPAGYSIVPVTWTIDSETFSGHKISFNVPNNGKTYYLKIGNVYSYNVVKWADCISEIKIENECNNSHLNWADGGHVLQLLLPKFIEMPPEFKADNKIIVGTNGIEEKTINQILKNKVQFIGVPGLVNYLNAIKLNSKVEINTQNGYVRIKNIAVQAEEINNGTHYKYELSFENYDSQLDLDDCCDIINLDNILAPDVENENPACAAFSIALNNNANVLSVTFTNPPTGVAAYKWFLNTAIISYASTVQALLPGDYRVEVSIGSCKKSGYYYKPDVCDIFKLDVVVINNIINATTSNAPDTVTYKVLSGTSVVSNILPCVVTTPGTYFVEASSGSCKRIKPAVISATDSCDYSLSINDAGAELQAVTTANSPSYLWELETSSGIVEISTNSNVPKTAKGIYWLTVSTPGGCSKKVYKYISPTAAVICSTINKATGYVFAVPEINLLSFAQPGIDLLISVNNGLQTYVSTLPSMQNNYSINSAGQLIFASSFALNNATIKVLVL